MVEQYSSARHHLGFYNNVGVSSTYENPNLETKDLKPVVFSALAKLIERHPILSTIVVNENSIAPYFARLQTVNLEYAVTFINRKEALRPHSLNDVELDGLLEEQHNVSFMDNYGTVPLWRLIVLSNPGPKALEFVACFIFHHAIGDGASGTIFQRHFFDALQHHSALDSAIVNSIVYPPEKDILPNLELIHPLLLPENASPKHVPQGFWSGGKVSLPPTRSCSRSFALSREDSGDLVRACRHHGVTITAAIPVLVASAVMTSIPEQFQELECNIPVDMRRWLSDRIGGDEIGVWLDAFSQFYRRENVTQFSWKETQRSMGTIKDYLETGGKAVNVAKFKLIKDMRKSFLETVRKERSSSLGVSNLGAIRVDESQGPGEWKMGRTVFSRSAGVSGSAISVGLVSGQDGCLVIGFSWQEEVVSSDIVQDVITKVKEGINQILKGETA